jgi:hypothetical protein
VSWFAGSGAVVVSGRVWVSETRSGQCFQRKRARRGRVLRSRRSRTAHPARNGPRSSARRREPLTFTRDQRLTKSPDNSKVRRSVMPHVIPARERLNMPGTRPMARGRVL